MSYVFDVGQVGADCLKKLEAEGWRVTEAEHYVYDGYPRTRWAFKHIGGANLIGIADSDDEALYIAHEERGAFLRMHAETNPQPKQGSDR